MFDIDADGDLDNIGWTRSGGDIGFLALDRNQNGKIDNGSELFGSHTPLPSGQIAKNGFEALISFDQFTHGGNNNGVIDPGDTVWPVLLLWIDDNHNGRSEISEIYHLNTFDLKSISLDFLVHNRQDALGNLFKLKSTCKIGVQDRPIFDVFFNAKPVRRPR